MIASGDSLERSDVGADASLRAARRLAETLIYEGYLLYPYRASAQKNQVRWQWGVLAPPGPAPRLAEASFSRAEILVEPRAGAELTLEVRFLQLQARSVERVEGGAFTPVESLTIDGIEYTAWDEGTAVQRSVTVGFDELVAADTVLDISEDAASDEELLRDAQGEVCGRFVRRRWPLHGRVVLHAERLPGPYGALALRLVTENVSDWDEPEVQRPHVMRHSLLGAHSVLVCSDGRFLSLLDPPEWAKSAVEVCVNERVWPVLVGEREHEVVLCSPIILYDHPEISLESPGDLYDALEIDEILSLRTMTLTDEEKRQARATDPRAAAIIDRVDSMPTEMIDRLHGAVRHLRGPKALDPAEALPWELAAEQSRALEHAGEAAAPGLQRGSDAGMPGLQRGSDAGMPGLQRGSDAGMPWWDPGMDAAVSPETDTVLIEGVLVGRGSKVRLMPGRHRRSDAQDAFLVGRLATVQAVLFDVDDATHLAVTVDGDPAAEMQQAHGRFLYFQPDEVDPEVDAAVDPEVTP